MAQEYLPAPSNIRLADLMKEHNISQPELAKEIGCSKSTISRFISGAKGTLTHEQVLKIARLFTEMCIRDRLFSGQLPRKGEFLLKREPYSSSAKTSPPRERWHGAAVTERALSEKRICNEK